MNLLSLSSIFIPEFRQRRTFDQEGLNSLREDIKANGLFNAIVLRAPKPGEPDGFVLCQGERRLRAIRDLYDLNGTFLHDGQAVPPGQVPYTTLGLLGPLEAEICELAENIIREPLTWDEEAKAHERIASLRMQIALEKGETPPTTAAIAKEVRGSSEGVHQGDTRKEIALVRSGMLNDPEVRGAKTLAEAWKVAKKKEEKAKHEALAEKVGKTFGLSDHHILNEDSLLWLPDCPDESFDIILTDPPYGMDADQFGDSGVTGRSLGIAAHDYADSEENFKNILSSAVEHFLRITRPQAHLYWFCDLDWFHELRHDFTNAGWWVHRTPLIWHKGHGLRVPWPEHGPRRSYELILYAVKGKRPVNLIGSDVLSFPADEQLGHSAQKPVALFKELLKRSAKPGDSILDPFAGSGPLLPAAHELKCKATLVEKAADHYGRILKRAEELK